MILIFLGEYPAMFFIMWFLKKSVPLFQVLLSEALLTTFTMVTGATFYALFIAQSMAYMIECNYSKIAYMQKMKVL